MHFNLRSPCKVIELASIRVKHSCFLILWNSLASTLENKSFNKEKNIFVLTETEIWKSNLNLKIRLKRKSKFEFYFLSLKKWKESIDSFSLRIILVMRWSKCSYIIRGSKGTFNFRFEMELNFAIFSFFTFVIKSKNEFQISFSIFNKNRKMNFVFVSFLWLQTYLIS